MMNLIFKSYDIRMSRRQTVGVKMHSSHAVEFYTVPFYNCHSLRKSLIDKIRPCKLQPVIKMKKASLELSK